MKFTVNRDAFLKPLQTVSGAVERRSTLPILGNILIEVEADVLKLTGTDLEVELVSLTPLQNAVPGSTTVPAKKILDIIRNLSDDAEIHFEQKDDFMSLKSGSSSFKLLTLPASEYPNIESFESEITIQIEASKLKHLLEQTAFAIGVQNYRYYLNGMCLEVNDNQLTSVTADGHRLAKASVTLSQSALPIKQVILPRKCVQELQRLLANSGDDLLELALGRDHICVVSPETTFTSKLLEGNYPDFRGLIPTVTVGSILVDRDLLRQACVRVAILSSELTRGIDLSLTGEALSLSSHTQSQESAVETLNVQPFGDPFEVRLNVNYLLEVINSGVTGRQIKMSIAEGNVMIIQEADDDEAFISIIMPMQK